MTAPAAASLVCPACGAAAVAGDRFCEACGADLPFTGPPAAVEAAEDEESAATLRSAPPPCASCGADGRQIEDGYCGVCGMKQPSPRDHLEVSVEGVAAVTDRGRVHHRNEDAFALHAGAGRVVAVVCDGVSTTVNPHLASEAAADAALGVLAGEGPPPPEERLLQAAVAARAAVEAVDGQPEPPGLGWPSCTFLAAVADAGTVDLATLGDCRAYWMASGGAAEVLTEDDSWAAEQVAAGALTPEVAYEHAFAHTITRWLGRDGDPSWAPRLARFEPPAPGRLVLCSDGLWNYAGAGPELAQAAGEGDLLTVARRLVTFANDAGGHDNITVVVLDVPPPAGAEPVAGSPAEPVTPEPRKGPPS